jgi:ribosomal protein S18 acetylase RimI-like enzyme
VRLSFELLNKRHDRASFACGVPELDRWFKLQAGQEERRNVARVVVANDEHGVAGFYTLSMFSLSIEQIPPAISHKLPRYPDVPATLIGRLARAQRLRGQGVGDLLVADAVNRVLDASRMIATFAIVVDAKDDAASSFYQRLGFIPFPTRPTRLFLLVETARAAVARSRVAP